MSSASYSLLLKRYGGSGPAIPPKLAVLLGRAQRPRSKQRVGELEGPLPQAGSLSPEGLAELLKREEADMKPEAALRHMDLRG